jgi:hypothetical protein
LAHLLRRIKNFEQPVEDSSGENEKQSAIARRPPGCPKSVPRLPFKKLFKNPLEYVSRFAAF